MTAYPHVRASLVLCTATLLLLLVFSAQNWLSWFDETSVQQNGNDSLFNNTLGEGGEQRQVQDFIEISEILPNCGIKEQCPEESFPVHIYTGQDKDDQPKLCIRGKYVIGNNINGGGRGLNAAIVDSVHFQVIAVHNFDLYSQNSTSLELWLANQVLDNDIIIVFTFDEASKELSRKAKLSLYRLGSGKIQDLQFRSQWYMISQKGINGFTSLEKLNFAKNDRWGEVIDERICVPRQIPPVTITPDPPPRKNPMREKFCETVDEMKCKEFCGAIAQHEAIYPALLTNRSLIGNPVYSTPLIVVGGSSLDTLSLTLQTLIHQPGIHSPSVLVLYPEANEEMAELVRLFSFQPVPINSTANNEHILFGLRLVKKRFPNKKYAIVLDEGLILSPDFLFYMAQLVFLFQKDDSIFAISAWNSNGYKNISSNPHLAYRSEHFPGLGFLLPLSVFDKYLEGNFSSCCSQPTVLGWNINGSVVIPDVSRVLRRPKDFLHFPPKDPQFQLFTQSRATNMDDSAWIEKPQELVKERYFQQLVNLIQESTTFHLSDSDLHLCREGTNAAALQMLHEFSGRVFAIYYSEMDYKNSTTLKTIARCFGMSMPPDIKPQGLYQDVFRFAIDGSTVLLIESQSPFFKSKLRSVTI
ncbi:protein O-linked-mannose beta-1,2-N-acetylglucosaminyltransferase 1-like [Macrosteles quadrilineatus]|uniref:protein O-linked-mannose beta-1,2-N-acetylglucosaminyltransferase 1-like n=1 Tax=Macrosteles quadrilineatus TaxID=74068 RepID=UPI0023E14B67|nr:protein O-linked-mannose beta-1,2-N-acetylglucosaminyltransferase 1-like [Macrosteles quadrilineatus]